MERLYCAYGGNLWRELMKRRCPDAEVVGVGTLKGMELEFRGNDPLGYYATVTEVDGSVVPVVVYSISEQDEASLDRVENLLKVYSKKMLDVEVDGQMVSTLVYIMNDTYHYGIPTPIYFDRLINGYDDFDLDRTVLNRALEKAYKRAR